MHAIEHFKTVTRHKRLVRKGCFKVGLYYQGIAHDMSKFSPTEFLVGAKYWQGTRSPNNAEREEKGYSSSWLHHKGRNKHHYEYWVDYSKSADPSMHGMLPAPMPTRYIVEMLMDRIAACKVYNGDAYTDESALKYYNKGNEPAPLHDKTRLMLELFLNMLAVKGEKETFEFVKKQVLPRQKEFDKKDNMDICLQFCRESLESLQIKTNKE